MSIFVIGINHKTAPIALREKIYFSVDKLALYLQDLIQLRLAREAVLISTCNRSELYCEADQIEPIREWFFAIEKGESEETLAALSSALYVHRDVDAVKHIIQVACGLDSMILGEPQILGQMKEAYSESCAAGTIGALFHRLFQQVFAIAKEIRNTTAIGACPVSVASAAVHFAKQQVPDFTKANIALIGAGDTTELLMRYLKSHFVSTMTIVNRSHEKALALAQEFGAKADGFDQLSLVLSEADIVFSATGSAVPLVTKETMEAVMQSRQAKPMMLIDVAVPRDIDPAITELPNVKLYCIDDLKTIIEKNRQGREHAADKARVMIQHKSIEFINEIESYDTVTHTIRAYRGQIEDICRAELIKAKQQLSQGIEATTVLDMFAQAFTKKLLHIPSVQLRQAGVEGKLELLSFAKQLFAIPDPEIKQI